MRRALKPGSSIIASFARLPYPFVEWVTSLIVTHEGQWRDPCLRTYTKATGARWCGGILHPIAQVAAGFGISVATGRHRSPPVATGRHRAAPWPSATGSATASPTTRPSTAATVLWLSPALQGRCRDMIRATRPHPSSRTNSGSHGINFPRGIHRRCEGQSSGAKGIDPRPQQLNVLNSSFQNIHEGEVTDVRQGEMA